MSDLDLPARIERYGGVVHFERVALAECDVATGTSIPHFEVATKAQDPRFKWFRAQYGSRCWELDALSPVILRQRVRDAIVALLDMPKWNRAVEAEAAERESMAGFMETWNKTISIPVSKYSPRQP